MSNVYNYAELKGKIKVGMRVKAVPGKPNECGLLESDGSNTESITGIDDTRFYIDGCGHSYRDDWFLEVVGGLTKTWDTLQAGDMLKDENGGTYRVLAVCGELIARSPSSDHTCYWGWYTAKQLQDKGFTIVQDKPEPSSPREVTMAEVVAKFGETVVIKKEG